MTCMIPASEFSHSSVSTSPVSSHVATPSSDVSLISTDANKSYRCARLRLQSAARTRGFRKTRPNASEALLLGPEGPLTLQVGYELAGFFLGPSCRREAAALEVPDKQTEAPSVQSALTMRTCAECNICCGENSRGCDFSRGPEKWVGSFWFPCKTHTKHPLANFALLEMVVTQQRGPSLLQGLHEEGSLLARPTRLCIFGVQSNKEQLGKTNEWWI